MGFWKSFFLGHSTNPQLSIIESEVNRVKSKIGELGSMIAINLEKGLPVNQLIPLYKEAVANGIYKVKEYKGLIAYQLDIIKDPRERSSLLYKMEIADKNLATFENITEF